MEQKKLWEKRQRIRLLSNQKRMRQITLEKEDDSFGNDYMTELYLHDKQIADMFKAYSKSHP